MSFTFHIPTRVLFGTGELDRLHTQELPGKKAMIVISRGGSVRKHGILSRTQEQLRQAGVEYVVFDQVQANPQDTTVMEGAAFARECGCDFLLALGGGSVMDASKAMAVMAVNDGELWDYIQGGTGLGKPFSRQPLPIVAITTTAGTGSEADPGGVITNPRTREKVGLVHPSLFPTLSIVDPQLMCSVPSAYTSYQGFDALFHSVEGYVSNNSNPMSDLYALAAIEEIGEYLPRAVRNGTDLEARERVAFGNTLSGMVMSVGAVTSQHALEHAMSAFHPELAHGAGLIMISRAYFAHMIRKNVCAGRFVRMAKALGIEDASEPGDFLAALCRLQKDCGVDGLRMSDYGILPGELEALAQNAMDTMGGLFRCDRKPLSLGECVAIYEASYR